MAKPLALTLGEPAGIGPDIAFAAWLRRAELELPTFYLLADPGCVLRRIEAMHLRVPTRVVSVPQALPVVDIRVPITAQQGVPDRSSAPAALAAIRAGVSAVCTGSAQAIVTNPVAKSVLYRSGFSEPGQTEFLATLAKELCQIAARPV